MNSRLRLAIEVAKKQACPNDTIERAIKKGAGLLATDTVEEISYEGYGPHGVGIIVECQTDNKHRTAPEIRNCFKKFDGNLGETGSVAWMFSRVGLIEGSRDGSFDPEEEAIEAGANEVEKTEDTYSFVTSLEDLASVREALEKRGWKISSCEPSYKAQNKTELNAEQLKDVEEFLNALDDMDDTHRVHATL
jgi:YebC/PmpR family DNA-binding regulatory protein